MRAIEILVNEHNLIRQALETLSLAKEELEEGVRPPVELFEKAVELSRTFTGKFHHFKEEYVMFARLAQRKNGALDGQIESLRHQHERSRDFMAQVANCLDGYAKGQEIPTSDLLENLAAYISLLRHHLHREDQVFYPMTEKELSEEEKKALAEEFEKEGAKAGNNVMEEARQLVMEMGALL
jgi:hemerythrin-like domain-containing protein